MNKHDLSNPQYGTLPPKEREAALRALPELDRRFTFLRFERFERFGMATDTAVYLCDGAEFVFVPGNTVTLGWDGFVSGMDEATKNEVAEAVADWGDEEFADSFDLDQLLHESMSPVRTATIPPMLVERTLHDIGWRDVPPDSPELLPFQSEIKKFFGKGGSRATRNDMKVFGNPNDDAEMDDSISLAEFLSNLPNGKTGSLELNETMRISRDKNGEIQAQMYEPISMADFISALHQQHFSLPTEDEWEYLCGGGSRSLFRWGDSFDFTMKLKHVREENPTDAPDTLEQPNQFGLSIAYDPYKQEVMENSEYFLKGGDGGCNLCGGIGLVLGYLPVATYFRDKSLSEDHFNYQQDIGGDYTFYRRIVRL